MPFSPRSDWVDLPATTTAIHAADLLRYESGIANLDCTFLPCAVATTAATTLSGTGQVIDTVTITAGMRVFNKDDTTGANRGIYVAGGGSWARSSDMPAGGAFKSGATVAVTGGSQAHYHFDIVPASGAATGVIGTDSLTITHTNAGSGGVGVPGSVFTVRAATTQTDSSTSGLQTVDSVVLAAGDRVFYQTSSTATFNGIYTVTSTGSWPRSTDMAAGASIPNGSLVYVSEGADYGGTYYKLTNSTAGSTGAVIGTDPLTIAEFASPNTWVAPTLDTTSSTLYDASMPAGPGHYKVTLDRNYVFGLPEGAATAYYVIDLVIFQDSTGGWTAQFMGSTQWRGVATDQYGQPVLSTEPNSVTYIRFTWLGVDAGYLGEV